MTDLTDAVNAHKSEKELKELESRINEGVSKHQAANKASPPSTNRVAKGKA